MDRLSSRSCKTDLYLDDLIRIFSIVVNFLINVKIQLCNLALLHNNILLSSFFANDVPDKRVGWQASNETMSIFTCHLAHVVLGGVHRVDMSMDGWSMDCTF